MESKTLKPFKGYTIEKSYELDSNGKIDKETIIYTAYDSNGDLFDGNTDLDILKSLITSYLLDSQRFH